MLRIRFLRVGKKNRPSFRLVVTPRRTAPQTGRFLEILGFHDPIRHEKAFKKERIQYWISQGAQPSDTVHNMLIAEGIIEGKKVDVHKKAKAKAEEPAAAPKEEKPAAAAEEKAEAEESPKDVPAEAEEVEVAPAEESKPEEIKEAPVEENPKEEKPEKSQTGD